MDPESQCVTVALNIRPLNTRELAAGCAESISVVPDEPQVRIGKHDFTFDYVFGSTGLTSSSLFEKCVAPVVQALFEGYNGSVLAYGQTGSGKTYTMGTKYNGDGQSFGVVPQVMDAIFSKVDALKDSTKFSIRVSFIEILKEEVFDLLAPNPPAISKPDGMFSTKRARVPIQIRETLNGEITLAGVTEQDVRTKEEMATLFLRGLVSRATGSTYMNSQSSRSHAIFTISMEQKRTTSKKEIKTTSGDVHDDILSAKLHLVDLAGSEGAPYGLGIDINKGLLALGQVISALGDDRKRKERGHVPYRDSKLTRLLQDSLGGNSKTLMIACVSPSHTNARETLNTMQYANRARNIQNKPIINRDPMAAQRMRNQIESLQSKVLLLRDSTVTHEEFQILKHKNSMLEASNAELQQEIQQLKIICDHPAPKAQDAQIPKRKNSMLEASNAELEQEIQQLKISCDHLAQKAQDAQMEKDKLVMKIESARGGKPWNEIDSDADQDFDLVKGYASKIQELEGELIRMQATNSSRKRSRVDCHGFGDDGPHSDDHDFVELDVTSGDLSCEFEVEEKEREHSSLQEQLDRELKELDKRLEQKEAEMKRFENTDTSVLKQHYEREVQELEMKKKVLQKEIEDLRLNLASIPSTSDDGAQKLKHGYLQKLNMLEAQVAELKKKQDEIHKTKQWEIHKIKAQTSDEAAKPLHDEIHKIKTQKVQLQQKIKLESEQFRLWKASREKEVLQAEMKRFGKTDTSVLKQHYEKKVQELEMKKKVLQKENEELRHNIASISSTSDDGGQKLNMLEARIENLHPLIVPVEKRYKCYISPKGTPSMIKKIYKKFAACHLLEKLEKSVFSPFFTMGENLIVQGAVIHNVLLQRISSSEPDELHFSFNGVECRFGPVEFGIITGLNFNKFILERQDYMCHDRLINKYFPDNSKITVNDLRDAFLKCTEADDVLKLGLCYFIVQVLFGNAGTDLVWLDLLCMVEDKNVFDSYPWGVEVYRRTLEGILHFDMSKDVNSRTYFGFPTVIQFWAYETIKDIAEQFATSLGDGFPRMLNWKCKTRVKYSRYIRKVSSPPVVSQMRPRSDVEQTFVESIQCPRPLFVHYDQPDYLARGQQGADALNLNVNAPAAPRRSLRKKRCL